MLSIAQNRDSWLTTDQLKYYTTPSAAATQDVEAFLAQHGVAKHEMAYNHLGNLLTVTTDAGVVSKMFNTTLNHYTNLQSKQTSIKATQLNLPQSLSSHIVHVQDLNTFVVPHRHESKREEMSFNKRAAFDEALVQRRSGNRRAKSQSTVAPASVAAAAATPALQSSAIATNPATPAKSGAASAASSNPKSAKPVHVQPSGCHDNNVTMPCMAEFYGYGDYRATVKKGHESVAAINYGLWTDASILYFEHVYGVTKDKYIPKKLYLGDDKTAWNNVTGDDGEAVLDAEMLIGTAYPLEVQVYSSSTDFIGNVQGLLNLTDAERPGVVSISYGIQENDATLEFYQDFCNHAQQLVALGTTFVTASGDNGVSENNSQDPGKSCPPFQNDLMSACPYVLSVGATTKFSQERAGYEPTKPDVHNGWSSGGFSNYEPTPSWQKSHVDQYLKLNHRQYSQYYNTSGRGWPDIAAFGQDIDTATVDDTGGHFWLDGGTSASSPIVSGILGLVNSKCKDVGKGRIGWIHPTLYANPGATNDITVGGAYLCEHDSFDSPLGLPCEKGWDPVTGMGSPNFPGLLKAFGCG